MTRTMQSDAHASANAEQLRLLLEDLELAAALARPGYTAPMRPADLTPDEIADQLARMYDADQGDSDDLSSAQERTALADYLGCHEDTRAAAWAAWSVELNPADWDTAQYWLDVEFIEPCPEHQM
ncbi:hypothetical protein [Deinococcus humi]|uniref:Uncharacterized protein n=1 Tax=Deinococcus humi TaxID=662880 RepID=A0A7W8JRT4_9DEIO|nr:hypothetical protein [Deinococcus humi]MBB5362037.1 hypothetical protein [Deinococcus humi]